MSVGGVSLEVGVGVLGVRGWGQTRTTYCLPRNRPGAAKKKVYYASRAKRMSGRTGPSLTAYASDVLGGTLAYQVARTSSPHHGQTPAFHLRSNLTFHLQSNFTTDIHRGKHYAQM